MEHIELIVLYVAITMFAACCLVISSSQAEDKGETTFLDRLYSKNFVGEVLFYLLMTIWYWITIHIIFIVPAAVILLILKLLITMLS